MHVVHKQFKSMESDRSVVFTFRFWPCLKERVLMLFREEMIPSCSISQMDEPKLEFAWRNSIRILECRERKRSIGFALERKREDRNGTNCFSPKVSNLAFFLSPFHFDRERELEYILTTKRSKLSSVNNISEKQSTCHKYWGTSFQTWIYQMYVFHPSRCFFVQRFDLSNSYHWTSRTELIQRLTLDRTFRPSRIQARAMRQRQPLLGKSMWTYHPCRKWAPLRMFTLSLSYTRISIGVFLFIRATAAKSFPLWGKVALVALAVFVVVGAGVGLGVYFGTAGQFASPFEQWAEMSTLIMTDDFFCTLLFDMFSLENIFAALAKETRRTRKVERHRENENVIKNSEKRK